MISVLFLICTGQVAGLPGSKLKYPSPFSVHFTSVIGVVSVFIGFTLMTLFVVVERFRFAQIAGGGVVVLTNFPISQTPPGGIFAPVIPVTCTATAPSVAVSL